MHGQQNVKIWGRVTKCKPVHIVAVLESNRSVLALLVCHIYIYIYIYIALRLLCHFILVGPGQQN